MSNASTRGKAAALLAAAALSAGLAACGGDDNENPGTAQKPTKIRVGVLPVAGMAPLYLGMKKGFFREEGLEIEPVVGQGGAAIVPAVMSNDFQIGFGNNISLMIARAKGLPIRIVAEGNQAGSDEATSLNGLLVDKKSGIRTIKDLEGKTIAVTTLNNLGEVTVKATLEKHGAKTDGLKFVELPFPEMNAAVQKGRADAAWQGEPFVTLGEEAGMRKLADPMIETMPSLSIATFFGADPYLDKHPEVVRGFRRALDRSYRYSMEHLDEARAIIPSFLKMPPDVLEKLTLNRWTSDLNVESIELTKRLGLKYGLIEKDFDLKDLLPKGDS